MKQLLFTNWHLRRWVRLAFAIFLFTQAYVLHEWMLIIFGLFFLIQVVFNMGCGANSCAIPNIKQNKDE